VKSTARWRVAAGSLLWLVGCGSSTPNGDGGTADRVVQEPMPIDAGGGTDASVVDGERCTSIIESHPPEGDVPFPTHIPCTSPATYLSEPPSSGNHYPKWAAYQTYTTPIPWGNLMHNLEHGAMIVVYNCPQGCTDEVARAQAWVDALPPDPSCTPNHRIILAPDPTLSVRFAATAWTWTLRSDCFDETAFTQFYADHYGHGLEVVCSSGASSLSDLCP
jgi:hypothetical protein